MRQTCEMIGCRLLSFHGRIVECMAQVIYVMSGMEYHKVSSEYEESRCRR